jgi:hypothetical protein
MSLYEFVCSNSAVWQHYVKDPITLINCGHSICKDCLPHNEPFQAIKCSKCGKVTDRDLRNDRESIIAKKMIKLNLAKLFTEMEKLVFETFDKVSGKLGTMIFFFFK